MRNQNYYYSSRLNMSDANCYVCKKDYFYIIN